MNAPAPPTERRARHVVVVDNSELARKIGERIRAARVRANLTQQQVAGDRYTAAYISALERGLAKPSLASMAYLAPRLRVRLVDLVDVDGETDAPEGVVDHLVPELRVRIHERIQEATGLISQAEDDLPREHPAKRELKDLSRRVWDLGYEILGAARYTPLEDLAAIIADLDEAEPFLTTYGRTPRSLAEQILARLHGRETADA